MRENASLKTTVVKWEEKEEKLCAFIVGSVVTIDDGVNPAQAFLAGSMIARSVASPAVRAAIRAAGNDPQAAVQVRTILMSQDGLDATALQALAAIAPEVRLIRDERLLNANEQMVLGHDRSWTGDCMRRDPSVRDSYESYAEGCAESARRAATSFQKMWLLASPLPPQMATIGSVAASGPADQPFTTVDAAAILEQAHTIIASTRH